MVKEKRILSYFLGWLIVGFCIIFVGVNNVFALEFEKPNYINFYDNNGSTLTSLGATCDEVRCISEQTATLVADSTGVAIAFQLDTQLIKGYNYSVTIFVDIKDSNDDDGISLSSKNYIGIGSNVANARNNYINKTGVTINTSYAGRNHIYYNFTVTSSTASQYIVIPFTTKQTVQNAYIRFWGSELISNGSGLTENQIDTITNNQTTILNNSIQSSTDTITGEINDMEQSIIDSNKETQEVIKDQFNECRESYNLYNNENKSEGYLSNTGQIVNSSSYYYTTDYIAILINNNYSINNISGANPSYCLYDNNYNIIECVKYNGQTSLTFNSNNANYIRFSFPRNNIDKVMFSKSNIPLDYEPYGEEICTNKIDETNDKLDNITGALTDSSPTDMSGLGDSAGWLPAGPVDSILTLPLTMLNNLVNNLSSDSCQTATLKLPYVKKNINLPCIKTLYEKIGITGTLFQSAGLIASAFILFNYLLKLYQWVDSTLTMRENTMPGYFDDNWGGGA